MEEFAESPASITIDEAFQRLHLELKEKNGYITCERFNTALREGRMRLHADSKEVKPEFLAGHLRVSVEKTTGGGWTAKMTAIRALERPVNEYEWTVSASDVGHLVEKPKLESPRRRPGPVTTHDWIAITAEIAFRCRAEVPKNEREFAKAVLQWCEDTYDKSPAESEMREAVKQVCARFRRG
jgi:hypothetical protein